MEVIEQLICFGLTRQEATIYLSLLKEGELTGYEAAKQTGISRSNTYNGLAGLVEKGAAYLIEGVGAKYTPVPLAEFCDNKLRSLSQLKEELVKNVPKKREESNGYITIKGQIHILDKVKNMIAEAKQRIYISISEDILKKIEADLAESAKQGIKIVIITDAKNYQLEGATVWYNKKSKMQIGLIVDTATVLTGEVNEGDNSNCLYSKNRNLVNVFKEMLKNEIKLMKQQ